MAALRRSGTSARAARACDVALDLGVLLLAAWTVVYHLCLILHLPAVVAAVAEALGAVPCAWLATRREPEAATRAPDDSPWAPSVHRRRRAVAVALVAAVAAGVLFGWATSAWTVTWLLWLVAAVAAVVATLSAGAEDETGEEGEAGEGGGGALAALAWSAALAVLSLFIVQPDTDDTQYVHLSAWIADHGRFPLRDILFTDQGLPSLFYPPATSYEALLGTLARGLPIAVPDLVYLVVVPVASVLAVLALWRLLRAWGVRLVAAALTVALAFLLFAAVGHRTLGSFFVGRIWQGKVLYVSVLVPIAFALLHEYAERPSRKGLALLGACGAAAVGLTTTAIFTLPVLAVACLLPVAPRRPRVAIAGAAATVAYPLAAGVVTLAVGGRNPDDYTTSQTAPAFLAHLALGQGLLGAVAVLALLAGAVAIPRRAAARALAVTALALVVLYAHGVPELLFHATGLGRVLWRMTWVVPVAALLGALAVAAVPASAPLALRLAPAAVACALLVVFGVPTWSARAGGELAGHPARKLPPADAAAAGAILARTRGPALVLAPRAASRALLDLSGRVTVVDPLRRYTTSLRQFRPRGRAAQRLALEQAVQGGVSTAHTRELRADLGALGVRVACTARPSFARLLADAGWRPLGPVPGLACRRSP